MATKYTLEEGVHTERLERETPFKRMHLSGQISERQRLGILFLAVALFIVALTALYRFQSAAEFYGQPVLRGTATVQEKWRVDGSANLDPVYHIRLAIDDGRGGQLLGETRVHDELWRSLEPGDRLAVLYQYNRLQTRIRIRETGLLAMPEGMG